MILMLQLSFSKTIILILIDPKKISIMFALKGKMCMTYRNICDERI